MGHIAQAGVATGPAAVTADAYPERGEEPRTLFLATLTIDQTLGPVPFGQALARSGEPAPAEASPPVASATRA
jgi:hypothetical protein